MKPVDAVVADLDVEARVLDRADGDGDDLALLDAATPPTPAPR